MSGPICRYEADCCYRGGTGEWSSSIVNCLWWPTSTLLLQWWAAVCLHWTIQVHVVTYRLLLLCLCHYHCEFIYLIIVIKSLMCFIHQYCASENVFRCGLSVSLLTDSCRPTLPADQPQKWPAGQLNWTGSMVHRGIGGLWNKGVAMVRHLKLDNKSPSDTVVMFAGSQTS